ELQNLAGMPGGFGKAREVSKRGVYKVIVRAWHEEVTRSALHAARELILAAMEDKPYDVQATIADLRDKVDSLCLGPSTASIVDAADDRNIPAIRLTEGNLVQLGYGKRQRRIWTAETDQTSAIAETISRDKDLTKRLLSSCGVPVPEGQEVHSPEEAWEAAQDIGLPVVVKPSDGNHGRGVFIELTKQDEIEAAYKVAIEEGSSVLVERSIPGTEHRLLVVGGKMVAANRGDMVWVTGDGKSSIRELIGSQVNSDPRRGDTEEHPLNTIRLDSAATLEIKRQGFADGDAVPPAGKEVLIQRNGNHAFDCTDLVHPETAATAALAARIVGLDIAGIDLVTPDISKPLAEQGGAIVEVNAGPSLLMHLKPAEGKPRPVGRAIVDNLFPAGEEGRIPVVGITGSKGKTAVARLVGHLMNLTGQMTAVACSDGLFYDRRQVQKTDAANWTAGHRILLNRAAEVAVIENGPRSILTDGLSYDRCRVGIVTNLTVDESLKDLWIEAPEQFYNVTRTQIDVVLPTGTAVLNAADPEVARMAELCDGEVIFFAADGDNEVIAKHRAQGKRTVTIQNGDIVLGTGNEDARLLPVKDIPYLAAEGTPYRATNLLAAVAAVWALGVAPDLMCAGIKTFADTTDSADAARAAAGKRKKN
ncbi:MAG TPA: cyanophycin synthetase, partial [Rhodocyclaceae bacterium]|nr:cyanophycin synthetase [Rhodocyclaceae bacterium]